MEVVDRLQMDGEHLSELASTATVSSDYRRERERRLRERGRGRRLRERRRGRNSPID